MVPFCVIQGFGSILDLVPLAENVVKLTAVCMMCYGEASFTKRRGAEKEVCRKILKILIQRILKQNSFDYC